MCMRWRQRSRAGRCSAARRTGDRNVVSPQGELEDCNGHCCTGDLTEIPYPETGGLLKKQNLTLDFRVRHINSLIVAFLEL